MSEKKTILFLLFSYHCKVLDLNERKKLVWRAKVMISNFILFCGQDNDDV